MTDTMTVHVPVESMTKVALIEHLNTEHGAHIPATTKITKIRLLAEHERDHTSVDFHAPHNHEEPEVAAPDAKVAEAAKAISKGNKPVGHLNASERKALMDIVTNDFKGLEHEVRSMADDARRTRLAAVEAEHAAKSEEVAEYKKRVRKVMEKANNALQKIKEEAETNGFTVQMHQIDYRNAEHYTKFSVEALQAAKKEVEAEIDADLKRGLVEVRSRLIAAQRVVLLTGVSGDIAQKVLDSIPSARDLMTLTGGGTKYKGIEEAPKVWDAMSIEQKESHLSAVHGQRYDLSRVGNDKVRFERILDDNHEWHVQHMKKDERCNV